MFSERFKRAVVFTRHAHERMAARNLDEQLIADLIETGEVRYKDPEHAWIAKRFEDRTDNLVCAAVLMDDPLVIETVMHHFVWEFTS